MAAGPTHNGWRRDIGNSRMSVYVDGTEVARFDDSSGDLSMITGTLDVQDGGTVTQASNKSTAVTLNTHSGQITMNGAALAAAAEVTFTLTNSQIAAADVLIVNHSSAGTDGSYIVQAGLVASGSCTITVGNYSAGSLSEAIVISFVLIKGASS
jgi:hypothetical protein